MAFTLGFHIILACYGIAFPTIVLIAEYLALRRRDETLMTLARRWSQALGVLVAVGAVTGTVLSFEMGLLWPGLMSRYGAALGLPFGFEGIFFFFLEAIFTAVYLYGWRRLRGWAHFWSGVPVAVSGIFGAISVVAANSWMNQPGGFTLSHGRVVAVDVWKVFFNRAAAYETPHMIIAAYMVTGFGVASVYAVGYLKRHRDRYHRLGFAIPFTVASALAPVQIIVGDTAARAVAHDQPIKFAAMEYVTHTARGVPEYLGGYFENGHVYFGLRLPDVDSLLVGFTPSTKVIGLDSVAPSDRPPALALIHLSFDAMVGLAFLLVLAALWALAVWRRRHELPTQPWFWRLAALCGPAALIAMECGWIVTEVGRQPWVVYRLLTTSKAATTNPNVIASLTFVIVLYCALGVTTVVVLRTLSRRWRQGTTAETLVPYGPREHEVHR
ncbi:MAG: cytochrome ubiquinol oxidase subunit I [Acidimicrobiales bacterium]